MNTLIIRHLADSGADSPRFQVVRITNTNQKAAEPVSIVSPLGWSVEGRPESNLARQMQWYLEDFLAYPFSPNIERAQNILDALSGWGKTAFKALFDTGRARDFFHDATRGDYQNLDLHVVSDDPRILQWPWEALHDPKGTYLSIGCHILRRLDQVPDPPPSADELPKDRINILLVTARPYEFDVRYRSISRPLVELIDENNIPAEVHVLRPPTFGQLQEHLEKHPKFYHVVHFDGHGNYGQLEPSGASTGNSHTYQGVLVFEDAENEPDLVPAEKLASLLRDHAVPIMVLNACRSAMLDDRADDPFASVAASLLKAGSRGVVAMAYSLYVSGAQEFLPAFYGRLFETGDLCAAVRAGRKQMFQEQKRVCARGRYELNDFLVPVLYEQEAFQLPRADAASGVEKQAVRLPEEIDDTLTNPYGFIGRDSQLLELERATRRDTPAVLIQGLGGVGKSTLARGFVRWLADTGGLDGCLWIGFQEVRSAEYVINQMGTPLFGPDFGAAPMDAKIEHLARALREHRLMIVWDNFEVVAGIPGSYISANLSLEGRGHLLTLLQKLRGGRSKVIVTSRSEEKWLGVQRIKVDIGGFDGEERWEYCEKILRDLNLEVNRKDAGQTELMELLHGHPLAMRVVLPQLEDRTAGQLCEALRSNIKALGTEAEALYATLQLAVDQLPAELTPLLVPLGLHEHFVDIDYLEAMTGQVEGSPPRESLERFFAALSAAGVLWHRGQGVYELHPALTGFLRSTLPKTIPPETHDAWSRAFVDLMGSLADALTPRPLHEQRPGFHCHGTNFHFALVEAERLDMKTAQASLCQFLGVYAHHIHNFSEADAKFTQLAEICKVSSHKEGEALAYLYLGMIAQAQRKWATAKTWYKMSLKISNERGKASVYHQLGTSYEEQGNWATAKCCYRKSLEISEKLGIEEYAEKTRRQLAGIAQKYHDSTTGEHKVNKDTAITYHRNGIDAHDQRDWTTAKKWYCKSLAISKKLGLKQIEAMTCHQLGKVARMQRKWDIAEQWYLESLKISEKLDDTFCVANTYDELGIITAEQKDFIGSGQWFVRSVNKFRQCKDQERAKIATSNFITLLKIASKSEKPKLIAQWTDAGLPPLESE